MAVFFFVVGMELAEEFRVGALRDRRAAILPVGAAIGGMAATALAFLFIGEVLGNQSIVRGWGVPTATDIAFTLGALTLVRKRVPSSLRVFLLTLAIADDLLAVLILALVFQSHARPWWLIGAIAVLAVLARWRARLPRGAYWLALVTVWIFFVLARVEPSLAGVAVGLLVPFGPSAPGARIERVAIPWSNGLVLPLFALCACGVAWSQLTWSVHLRQVVIAVIVARIIGKVIGITGVFALGTRAGLPGPAGVTTPIMASASILCAVGFTVPLLFAEAVYGFNNVVYEALTLGLLATSVIATLLGVGAMRAVTRPPQE
jgi:NhaA family Na+:H+ antiporter